MGYRGAAAAVYEEGLGGRGAGAAAVAGMGRAVIGVGMVSVVAAGVVSTVGADIVGPDKMVKAEGSVQHRFLCL